MEFLRKEFEGVPDEIVAAALAQIEEACRAARMVSAVHHDTSDVLAYMRICAKIGSVLEFLQRFRKTLQQTDVNPSVEG